MTKSYGCNEWGLIETNIEKLIGFDKFILDEKSEYCKRCMYYSYFINDKCIECNLVKGIGSDTFSLELGKYFIYWITFSDYMFPSTCIGKIDDDRLNIMVGGDILLDFSIPFSITESQLEKYLILL